MLKVYTHTFNIIYIYIYIYILLTFVINLHLGNSDAGNLGHMTKILCC